ncbi:MAG: pyridoxal phosphate-dependent aminotransferase [Candidatus Xenobia bacterium]
MNIRPFSTVARGWGKAEINPLTAALRARRAPYVDLILANPHEHGLEFPQDVLERLAAEAMAVCRVYRPDPRGQGAARAAIAAYYRRRGVETSAEQILLTPGTSLAYWYLLRVLLEPGDELLIPRPGYPLFEDLCDAAGVRYRYYHLRAGRLDLEEIAFQITPRTRAIGVVSPHNPLGTVCSREELDQLEALCAERGLALLFDEVFCEFLTAPSAVLPRPRNAYILNGVSKMLSLPGHKVGWIRAPREALPALEYISDIFLPVSEVAQAMVPGLLEAGERVMRDLATQYRERRHLTGIAAEGGVYACVPLAPGTDDDALALRALNEIGVLVHPGHFYSLPEHLVMTCVPRPEVLRTAVPRLHDWLAGAR